MKKLLFALLFLPCFAYGVAHDTYIDKRNASNTATNPITIAVPLSDAVYWLNRSTYLPGLAEVGNGLLISGGNLRIDPAYTSSLVLATDARLTDARIPLFHNHDAADVTTGVFADFRIPALEISKTNGLQTELDNRSLVGHAHVSANISDSTLIGRGVLTSATQADARTAIAAEQSGAASSAQAYAIQRANHTGPQSADTITDGATNKAYTATEKTKLAGIAAGATANSTDAQLRDRSTHTGTITASVVSDFNSAADARVNAKFSGSSSQVVLANGAFTALPVPQAIQRTRVQTDASGNYTWTYPVAYPSGVVPVLTAISESASSTVPQGVQIVGVPTNTSATFKVINLPSTSVLSIVVLGAPTAAQAYIHLTAVAP